MIRRTRRCYAFGIAQHRRRSTSVAASRQSEKRQWKRAQIAARAARFQRSQNQPVRSTRMGAAPRRNHRRRRQSHIQAGKRRGAQDVVVAGTKVVVSKYFLWRTEHARARGFRPPTDPPHLRTIADWGVKDGYFSKADGEIFYDELAWLCLNQCGAFNSPVWFNVGLYHQYGIGKNSGRGNWFLQPQDARSRTRHDAI